MSSIEFINKLNKNFKDIKNDFDFLSKKLPELLNNDLMIPDDFIDFEISLSDLNVNLQLICMKINEFEYVLSQNSDSKTKQFSNELLNDRNEKKENDLLVSNTMTNFLPLMMMYMMLIDKNSILNSKTFSKKNNDSSGNSFNSIINENKIILPDIELD